MTARTKTPSIVEPARRWSSWLCEEWVRAYLKRRVEWPEGCRLHTVRVARVYPYKKDAIGVEYALRLDAPTGRHIEGAVFATDRLAGDAAPATRPRVQSSGPLAVSSLSLVDRRSGITVHTPDRDRDLPQIAEALGGPRIRERLKRRTISRWLGSTRRLRCRCLNYRPGRRCTIAYEGAGGRSIYGKIHRRRPPIGTGEFFRRFPRALRLRSAGSVITPRLLASWTDFNMLVFEGLTRHGSGDGALDLEDLRALEGAGLVLRCFHSMPRSASVRFTAADELVAVGRWVELAGSLRRLTPIAERLWQRLCRIVAHVELGRAVLLHRDFYESQLLRTGDSWAVLDLDTATLGDREQDLANFVGHLVWAAIRTGRPRDWWTPRVAAFLEQYLRGGSGARRIDGLNSARFRFYLSGSLLRLGIIHALRSQSGPAARRLHRLTMDWSDARDWSAILGVRTWPFATRKGGAAE